QHIGGDVDAGDAPAAPGETAGQGARAGTEVEARRRLGSVAGNGIAGETLVECIGKTGPEPGVVVRRAAPIDRHGADVRIDIPGIQSGAPGIFDAFRAYRGRGGTDRRSSHRFERSWRRPNQEYSV